MSRDEASAGAPNQIAPACHRLITPIARELQRLPRSSLDRGRVEDVDVDLLISSLGDVEAALHSGSPEQLAALGARLVRAAACAVTACGPDDVAGGAAPQAAIAAVLNSVAERALRRRRHRAAGLCTSGTLDAFDLDGVVDLPVDLREAAEANTRTDLLAYSGAILCEYAAVIADDLDDAGLKVETLLAARTAVEGVAEFMSVFPLHRWLVEEDDPGFLFQWALSSTLRGEPICPDGVDADGLSRQRGVVGLHAGGVRPLVETISPSALRRTDLWFNKRWIERAMRKGSGTVDIDEPPGYTPSV